MIEADHVEQPAEQAEPPSEQPFTVERLGTWLGHSKRVAGGFSVRTKILGIVLVLTTVLGLGITWQVRTVMNIVATTELEARGLSVVSALAA